MVAGWRPCPAKVRVTVMEAFLLLPQHYSDATIKGTEVIIHMTTDSAVSAIDITAALRATNTTTVTSKEY